MNCRLSCVLVSEEIAGTQPRPQVLRSVFKPLLETSASQLLYLSHRSKQDSIAGQLNMANQILALASTFLFGVFVSNFQALAAPQPAKALNRKYEIICSLLFLLEIRKMCIRVLISSNTC